MSEVRHNERMTLHAVETPNIFGMKNSTYHYKFL